MVYNLVRVNDNMTISEIISRCHTIKQWSPTYFCIILIPSEQEEFTSPVEITIDKRQNILHIFSDFEDQEGISFPLNDPEVKVFLEWLKLMQL